MKQDEILATLAEIINDEAKCQTLENLLQIIQDNSLQNNLNDLSELQKKKAEIKNQHKEVSEILADAKLSQEHIDEIYYKIYNIENEEGEGNSSQVLIDIEDAQTKAQEMKESYQQFYNTKDSQGNETQGIITKLKTACKQIEDNKDNIADFKKFYNEVFEGVENEKGEIIKPALVDFLENKKKELNNLFKTHDKALDDLRINKENEIDELLPGATSAGLAKAYRAEKRIAGQKTKFWNEVFIISSSIFFLSLICFYIYTSFYPKLFPNSPIYDALMNSLPLWIFGGFIIYYCTKQIAEYKRLESEYAHKETLNNTYKGYETQIKNAQDEKGELNEKLLDIMLESARLNPSITLGNNNGEIPSLSLLEKIIDMLPLQQLRKIYDYIGKKLPD